MMNYIIPNTQCVLLFPKIKLSYTEQDSDSLSKINELFKVEVTNEINKLNTRSLSKAFSIRSNVYKLGKDGNIRDKVL